MCDRDFIKACLLQILGEDASDEIVEYILTIENEDDYNEFMDNIVNKSNTDHLFACDALKENLLGSEKSSKLLNSISRSNGGSAPKTANNNTHVAGKNVKPVEQSKGKKNQQQNKNKQDSKYAAQKQQSTNKLQFSTPAQVVTVKEQEVKQTSNSAGKGKKLKFVNFYSHDHKPGLLKGRHPCNCEAKKHNLINNCIKCGRIVCEQEGSGPCFFCDNMVCTNEEMELLTANTKESDKFYNYLMERSRSKEWKKALETRDRLLLNDSLGNAKNVIYDDQCDYFKVDKSGAVSEGDSKDSDKAKKDFYSTGRFPRHEMRMSLNLATRTVTVEEREDIKNEEKFISDVHKLLEIHSKRFPKYFYTNDKLKDEAAEIMKEFAEQEIQTVKEQQKTKGAAEESQDKNVGFSAVDTFKPANQQLQEIVDAGMCLSMHQPYASLLVAGIKKHEGRTWNTNHRGRLWIAAAAKQPSNEEILECEEMYRNYYCDPSLKFPRTYPVSCLLGCVHVDDCLPQREYVQLYPKGESSSPFVLICRNPVILPVFYPMSGQHKIFPLKKDLHRRARAALLTGTWVE